MNRTKEGGKVSVYRSPKPKPRDFRATQHYAQNDPALRLFLTQYSRGDRFLDWGDDPSFFAAQHFLGSVNRASWGVCRPDVRACLDPGDFVVFFCAKPTEAEPSRVHYFFVGVATVRETIDRQSIWQEPQYFAYQRFYNVLAKYSGGVPEQYEQFHPYHKNWSNRLSPYILFDPSSDLTSLNIRNPLWVATSTGEIPETWRSSEFPNRRLLARPRGRCPPLPDLVMPPTGRVREVRRVC